MEILELLFFVLTSMGSLIFRFTFWLYSFLNSPFELPEVMDIED